jgi:branched-chain amino acid transport system ATP-binding protein
LLDVDRLVSYYGPIRALRGVSLRVEQGEAVAVLGPNGAGKSTLLRSISALVKPRHGSITYQGRRITGKTPHEIVRLGVVHVPEGRHIFTQLTVYENLMMGAYSRDGADTRDDFDFVFGLFPDLAEKKRQRGGELSGGQQQMLAIGRALMSRPTLLLLDEPSLGLSPILVEQLGHAIEDIRKRTGMSLLLVEQNAALALEMTTRFYVMQTGRVAITGVSSEVALEEIRHAYLGGPAATPV